MVLGQEKAAVCSDAGFGAISLGISRNRQSFDAFGKREIGQECLIMLC
jgi:hypothetical protein